MNPFNPYAGFRPANVQEAGLNHSHTIPELKVGDKETLLKVDLTEVMPGGFQGLATVEVTAQDVTLSTLTEVDVANGVVQLEVSWQDGLGGGVEILDATRGHVFTCGGFTALNIVAQWVSADGNAIKVHATKKLECTVHWLGSANPKPARATSTQVALAGGGAASAWIPIPLWARDMIAMSDTPAGNAALTAEFSGSDGVAGVASIRYRTLNPVDNGTLIGAGVEFVRFTSADAMKVIAFWDQWN